MDKMVNFDFFKNKRILVLGDSGFKGSWLSFLLNRAGAEVYGYSLPPSSANSLYNLLSIDKKIFHVDGDILDSKHLSNFFLKSKPEIVFHLAAQAIVSTSYEDPKSTFDTNIGGSVNILEQIRKCEDVKSFVYVTSDKCYKNNEWIWGYRENDELGGHDPYSASKAGAEIVFSSYNDSFFCKNINLGVGSVRAGNVIGGGDWADDRIIPDCIRSLSKNKNIILRNPNSTRPWQHVLEPLSGYMMLAEKLYINPKKYSGSWNFGPNSSSIKSVEYLVKRVINFFGSGQIEISSKDQLNYESNMLHLNCDKANLELNWYPRWEFEDTIKHTVSWYKQYLNGESVEAITINNINMFMR